MKRVLIKKGAYYDSVTLMLLSKEMGELEGVTRAMVAMATPTNREILGRMGWSPEGACEATENDLLVAVESETPDALEAALRWMDDRLRARVSTRSEGYRPKTLRTAIRNAPGSNLVQISVPGAYAYREARRALSSGRHVMLFSDNVSIEEEVALKTLAEDLGLLLMGPDCGTAVLNGVCLGFANVLPRGPVGIVSASGTGAQETSVLLARYGVGVSQVIGTGGRDLSREVGGRMMRQGLRALEVDPDTQVIVLVSKPPAGEIGDRILDEATTAAKPVVVNFLGQDPGLLPRGRVKTARTLEETALLAARVAVGGEFPPGADVEEEAGLPARAARERARLLPGQRYVRGLFVGGTLADEAMVLLKDVLGAVHSNGPTPGCRKLADSASSEGHTILDLGADEFTAGRAHPMIDPTLRNLRLHEEARDPQTAALLVDVVLGYGCHPNPAGELAGAIETARSEAGGRGRRLPVLASVCGTNGDPQNLEEQEQILKDAGALVFSSNARACRFCGMVLEGR